MQHGPGGARYLHILFQRRGGVGQGVSLVRALVDGHGPGQNASSPMDARGDADGGLVVESCPRPRQDPVDGFPAQLPVAAEVETLGGHAPG